MSWDGFRLFTATIVLYIKKIRFLSETKDLVNS